MTNIPTFCVQDWQCLQAVYNIILQLQYLPRNFNMCNRK